MIRDFNFYRRKIKELRENPEWEGQIEELKKAKWSALRRETKKPLYILAALATIGGSLYLDSKSNSSREMYECLENSQKKDHPLLCAPGLINFGRL